MVQAFKESKKEGWIQSSIEPALFYLYEGGELCGIMISHVDDLYTAGEGNYFEEAMKRLTKKIHLKEQKGEFKFCWQAHRPTEGRADLYRSD